jgi:hypothetical protein
MMPRYAGPLYPAQKSKPWSGTGISSSPLLVDKVCSHNLLPCTSSAEATHEGELEASTLNQAGAEAIMAAGPLGKEQDCHKWMPKSAMQSFRDAPAYTLRMPGCRSSSRNRCVRGFFEILVDRSPLCAFVALA